MQPIGAGGAVPLQTAGTDRALISGAYQFWNALLHPFFAEVRAWTVLRAADPPRLGPMALAAGLLEAELRGAERFRDAMGDTPLTHLRTLRKQRAGRWLADTDQRLEAIAAAVGYQDAFGFSKVFKRTTGASPREFRQRNAEERAAPWRFGAA